MATTQTTLTVSGTPVSLHPALSTPYPQPDECALTYRRPDGTLLAWDVVYGLSFSSEARTCHPPEVTDWWFQSEPTATYMAFGPTFECPEAYRAAQTALISGDAGVQQVFCCPSSFSLLVAQPLTNSFPSQCISTATPGQVISFLDIAFPKGTLSTGSTTSTVDDDTDITVFGQPVNGFNVVASVTGIVKGTNDSADEGGTPKHVIIGASVGAVAGLALILLGAWLLWRRRANSTPGTGGIEAQEGGASSYPGMEQQEAAKPPPSPRELSAHRAEAELPVQQESNVVYELPGNARRNSESLGIRY